MARETLHAAADATVEPGVRVGADGAVYVDGPTWERWEAETRSQAGDGRARRRAAPADLDAVAAVLASEGLRPVVDRELDLVRAECPSCYAGQSDPLMLWRPLVVAPRPGGTRVLCDHCGNGRV